LFNQLWKTAESNSVKVLNALKEVRLAESDLWGSTGYGLDDFGRENLKRHTLIVLGLKPHWSDRTFLLALM